MRTYHSRTAVKLFCNQISSLSKIILTLIYRQMSGIKRNLHWKKFIWKPVGVQYIYAHISFDFQNVYFPSSHTLKWTLLGSTSSLYLPSTAQVFSILLSCSKSGSAQTALVWSWHLISSKSFVYKSFGYFNLDIFYSLNYMLTASPSAVSIFGFLTISLCFNTYLNGVFFLWSYHWQTCTQRK